MSSNELEESAAVLDRAFTFHYLTQTSTLGQGVPVHTPKGEKVVVLAADDIEGLRDIQSICNAESNDTGVGVVSRLCGVRGKVYGMLDNSGLASQLLRTSVELDVRNIHSWDEIMGGNFMSVEEGEVFLTGLDFKGRVWLKDLYYTRLRRQMTSTEAGKEVEGAFERLKGIHGLGGCGEVLVREAQATWDRHEVKRTAEIVEKR